MNRDLQSIILYLKEKRSLDFSGYRPAFLEKQVTYRLQRNKLKNFSDYFRYLQEAPGETSELIHTLTISVSSFFRNPLTFACIEEKILPSILREKYRSNDTTFRIWSSGCSAGEEPYSIAILLHEMLQKEKLNFHLNLFATDIDHKSLNKAQQALYPKESLQNVRFGLLEKYFTTDGQLFRLASEIRDMVLFCNYNMLYKKSYAPPESIFGGFDLILCRNLLIYFNTEVQHIIFNKLYRSLKAKGYLVLGEAEKPPDKFKNCFVEVVEGSHIYQKTH